MEAKLTVLAEFSPSGDLETPENKAATHTLQATDLDIFAADMPRRAIMMKSAAVGFRPDRVQPRWAAKLLAKLWGTHSPTDKVLSRR